jgi:hypothetical protein
LIPKILVIGSFVITDGVWFVSIRAQGIGLCMGSDKLDFSEGYSDDLVAEGVVVEVEGALPVQESSGEASALVGKMVEPKLVRFGDDMGTGDGVTVRTDDGSPQEPKKELGTGVVN